MLQFKILFKNTCMKTEFTLPDVLHYFVCIYRDEEKACPTRKQPMRANGARRGAHNVRIYIYIKYWYTKEHFCFSL